MDTGYIRHQNPAKTVIDYSKLQRTLKHLQAQFENCRTLDPSLPVLIQEAVSESVIQRFKTTWDCLWKVLKCHLEEKIGLSDLPNGPKPILRLANENRLLPGDIENGIRYANARVATSHDYSGEKAKEALALMDRFIQDAIALYERLTGEEWK